jgi:DNA ligase (NAD+)
MSADNEHEGGIDLGDEARLRATELAGRLEKLKASYYAGKPDVSDAAYDALEDELRAIDPTSPVLAKVGTSALVAEWPKGRHEIPMGSLNKAVDEAELRAWLLRCEELLAKEEHGKIDDALFVAEKLDGISIEVIYRGGKLAEAITRGDGEYGERITENVARMKGVPPRVAIDRPVSFRGEIILRLSDMKRPFFATVTSPRNAAAGTSKRFDGTGSEYLTVLFYDVADQIEFKTERDKFAWLRQQGLATPRTAFGSIDDVMKLYESYSSGLRASLDYEIDGLVVYVDSLHAAALLGEVNHRPRGAIAFKFASPAKVTQVVAITWDTGPSGRITPVAIVMPVELAGATVQRASLHNAANVRALGIAVGDEVLVSRRNDVIPYVEEVVEKKGTPTEAPTHCPRCSAAIFVEGEYLICRNLTCPAIVEGRILNWISAINALEWGDKLIHQLVESGKVKEPGDLYRLTIEDIASLDRRGEKTAKKCLAELEARLPLTLPVFIAALGMENFALQTARLIVSAGYNSLEKMFAATEEELAAIAGLGPIKAANVARGLASRKDEIGRLVADPRLVPVAFEQEGPLVGLTFCFTGSSTKPRAVMTDLVEKNGGRVLSGVTKDLAYLVIADPESTSSKAVKARKLGTKLITEEELDALVAGGPKSVTH